MQRQDRGDSGAAAVEFALVLPLLMLLVFGVIQFGIAFAQQLSLNSAARQGARSAVVGGIDCTGAASSARAASRTIGIGVSEAAALTVVMATDPDGTSDPCTGSERPCEDHRGDAFRVDVSRAFTVTIPMFGNPQVTLRGRGEYRCESNS